MIYIGSLVSFSTEIVVSASTVQQVGCSHVMGFVAYTQFFRMPHRKKSGVFNSGHRVVSSTSLFAVQQTFLGTADLKTLQRHGGNVGELRLVGRSVWSEVLG
jgi:hypothetical protein